MRPVQNGGLAQGGLAEGSETNDLRRLELVHDAVGDEISIAFDANQRECNKHDMGSHHLQLPYM